MNQLQTLRMRAWSGLPIASLGVPILHWLAAMLMAVLLTACGGGGGDSSSTTPPLQGVSDALVTFTVIDTLGQPVAGATLRSARATALTNAQGRADVSVPAGSEQVIAVEKDGFAEQVKVITLSAGTTASSLQAMLIAREVPLTIAANEAGGSVIGKLGVKLSLPPAALVTSSGAAVTGPVDFTMTPVDVTQLDIGAFPGLFEGMPTGAARSLIISYGTAELVPRQSGQKLQLAAGKSAEIELPMYVATHQDGSTAKAGDNVALWSLNAATGLWTHEGEGTVVRSAGSPTGLALRATITHFSWWNVDATSGRASVNLTVNVPGETLPPGTVANVEGRVVAGAGPTWAATTTATPGVAVTLVVPAGSTTQLSARIELSDRVCAGTVNVSPPAGSAVNATINATCAVVPVPRILRPGALSATNSQRDISIQMLIDGPRADLVEVFVNPGGTAIRIAQFNAAIQVQPFFTAFWNSLPFAEGTYSVFARATRAGISRDSAPVQIVVDRTPPTLASITPAPDSDVSQATTFTLDFSEPVNPLPFALTDAVKLAVTPLGAAAPVDVPVLVVLDASGLQLTVQPQAALPLGAVSLTWGGLQDAAANAVAGTVTAIFAVERMTALLVVPQRNSDLDPALAIDASGRLVVAWAETDGNVRVGVREGGAFTLFGAPADNPVNSRATFGMVLDPSDRPVLALRRDDNSLVVRRFEAGAWQDLGPAFSGLSGIRQLRLLVDAAGRPVLAFQRGFFVEVHRFEAASSSWVSLGVPTAVIGGAIDTRFDMALMPNGDPVLALVQGFFGSNAEQLRVARHNGSTWVALGGVLDSTPNATQQFGRPNIAGGLNGPWLHYVKTGGVLRLLRFDGSGWEINEVPRPAGATTLQNPNALGLLNDDPVIAFNDFSLGGFVTRFSGGRFEALIPTRGRASSMALAIRGGQVLLGEEDSCCNLIVKRVLFP